MKKNLLLIVSESAGAQTVSLIRRITTIGSDANNEIALSAPIPPFWLQLVQEGEKYRIEQVSKEAPLLVNGKKQKSCVLKHGDAIPFEGGCMIFWEGEFKLPANISEGEGAKAYKLFIEASKIISEQPNLDSLLSTLLDGVISIAGADKGFIVLQGEEEGDWQIKFARHIDRKNIEDAEGHISDSIVQKALETGEPLVISDALADREFSAAQSIIALRLSSVMCIPLRSRAELLGCIYIGNHGAINNFTPETVSMVSAFATQAALLVKNALLINELTIDNTRLREELKFRRFGDIIGSSQGMQNVFTLIRKVAPTDVSVLVEGETGTGKELIARELHRLSPRAGKLFITINCGAIPENLLESELFGYKRGAFTGAVADKKGKAAAADGGTLFLDEISEMPLSLQVKLLQLLQNKIITPIGDTKEYPVDIRVIAATNKKLAEEVEKGRFRNDLYYRLNVVSINLPPLRERGDDIVLIARYFLDMYRKQYSSAARRFSKEAISALLRYDWPGNVRELENIVRQGAVLANEPEIGVEQLGLSEKGVAPIVTLGEAKNNFAKEYVEKAVKAFQGNRTAAAEALGIDARTIRRLLNEKEP